MHTLSELVNWAKGRYASVAKDYERFDESWGDGFTVVYCSGTLRGVWLDGSNFEGVRFIDRFEIADGKIRRQDVWNDLAETLAQGQGGRLRPGMLSRHPGSRFRSPPTHPGDA